MTRIDFTKVNDLLTTKYNATIITKQQFKDAVYGFNREDIDNSISTFSEGIITNENAVFYLINDTCLEQFGKSTVNGLVLVE